MLFRSLFFLRRQQRARIVEAANRARYEEHLTRYRRESAALAEDRDLLQTLLDSRDDAICLVDTEGAVLAANRAACIVLGAERDALDAQPLPDRFASEDAAALKTALERMEDAQAQSIVIAASADLPALRADMRQWEGGDGLIVVALRAEATTAANVSRGPDRSIVDAARTDAARIDTVSMHAASMNDANRADPNLADSTAHHSADASDANGHVRGIEVVSAQSPRAPSFAARPAYLAGGAEAREEFRRALVALMLAVVETWERSTGTNRIELAERSRLWRVNIDDGRLRARAMERYLGVSKLPENPRWRDVLRTAYYVLAQCPLEPAPREELQALVDAVLVYTRRSAMV